MYKLITEEKRFEEKIVTVYGIYYDDEYYVSDISVNREKVMQMVGMFNRLDLAPCHLYDVVEDMLD